ncbi:MAG: cyclase family protein [Acidimicrobiales bacterium]
MYPEGDRARAIEIIESGGEVDELSSTANQFDDTMFDVSAVEQGAWVPGPYGPGDERGTFNEVTPEKTARALALLKHDKPVVTYSLAETMVEGFPAWGNRTYQQHLVVTGYSPSDDFGGILTGTQPRGPGRMSVHEERVSLSYNMGTKINGLHHVGVGDMFYNGFLGPDIARTWGTTNLGAETMGPIVTRGVLVDVVGSVVASGRSEAYEIAPTGRPILQPNYRITVEDIETALVQEGVESPIGPGDVILLRTGWRELIEADPERYVAAGPPGPFLRECRYLADRRPALIGSDTWCFECVDPQLTNGCIMPCHQELSTRFGIRIGEGVPTNDLADDGVYEFVFCFSPLPARGAIASNTPPLALGQPTKRP